MPRRHKGTKIHKGMFEELSEEEERIGKAVVNASYIVHKDLKLTNKRLGCLINFNVPLSSDALTS